MLPQTVNTKPDESACAVDEHILDPAGTPRNEPLVELVRARIGTDKQQGCDDPLLHPDIPGRQHSYHTQTGDSEFCHMRGLSDRMIDKTGKPLLLRGGHGAVSRHKYPAYCRSGAQAHLFRFIGWRGTHGEDKNEAEYGQDCQNDTFEHIPHCSRTFRNKLWKLFCRLQL